MTIAVCCLCVFLVGFGGSVLFIVLPAIAADFHAEVGSLARLGATLALGAAAALPLSVVADRWRRGPMATIAIAGFSVAAGASALSGGLGSLAMARFFAVCCETLVAAVATAVAVEVVDARYRGRALSLLALSSGAGAGLTVLAYPLVAPHWRLLYAAAAVVGFGLAPLALRLPGPTEGGLPEVRIIWTRPWRRRVAVLALSAALLGILFEPANFFAVLLGSTRLGLTPGAISGIIAASGAAAALGFLVGGWLTDRLGRRRPAISLLLASALLAAASFSLLPALYIGAGIAASAIAGAAGPVASAWTAELVPGRVRVTALATVGIAGALGGVAGLQLVGALVASTGLVAAVWITAVPALLGAAVLGVLPETRGQPLVD